MAAKRRKKRSGKRKGANSSPAQKFLVVLSLMVLVLCAASVTWSFFVRRGGGEKRPFTVEILNGVGESGIAHQAKRSLLQMGIDVIAVGNAPHFGYEESVLVATKRGADVEKLGEILGCRNVVVQIREGAIEDASLILGADYRSLNLDWDDE
ncbi:MAG: LytR C-terminal domain-containing protein [Candidatus Latescibacterota bacterium]|jgi:hypothetical protein